MSIKGASVHNVIACTFSMYADGSEGCDECQFVQLPCLLMWFYHCALPDAATLVAPQKHFAIQRRALTLVKAANSFICRQIAVLDLASLRFRGSLGIRG